MFQGWGDSGFQASCFMVGFRFQVSGFMFQGWGDSGFQVSGFIVGFRFQVSCFKVGDRVWGHRGNGVSQT